MNRSNIPSEKRKNYLSRFKKAKKRTKELSLKIDKEVTVAVNPSREDLIRACVEAFSSKDNMAYNCPHTAAVNERLKANGFNTGQITIGYLSYNNEYEYFCDTQSLVSEINSKSESAIPMHVWITFPDGTIFDPTVFASFEKDAGNLSARPIETLPLVSMCDFEGFPVEIEYFPLLVGRDYLVKSSAIIESASKGVQFGSKMAAILLRDHSGKQLTVSFNDMKSFYKKNDPDNYKGIVSGFRVQMNHYISEGLVTESKSGSDIEYSIV